ncbi:hypothetical protein [uncultured Robinsoniella sp.]|uniref:hypothetical protein n=1 Tax=Robinsoniella sp. TaxID=2496533 RepID=UPI00374F3919
MEKILSCCGVICSDCFLSGRLQRVSPGKRKGILAGIHRRGCLQYLSMLCK